MDFDIIENDEFDHAASSTGDFLRFPYYLDVEASSDGVGLQSFVSDVAELLDDLRRLGADFVTAADIEDDLPGHGRTIDLPPI